MSPFPPPFKGDGSSTIKLPGADPLDWAPSFFETAEKIADKYADNNKYTFSDVELPSGLGGLSENVGSKYKSSAAVAGSLAKLAKVLAFAKQLKECIQKCKCS